MSISADPPDRELTLAAVLEARAARAGTADFILAESEPARWPTSTAAAARWPAASSASA